MGLLAAYSTLILLIQYKNKDDKHKLLGLTFKKLSMINSILLPIIYIFESEFKIKEYSTVYITGIILMFIMTYLYK